MTEALLRRAADLWRRCDTAGILTATPFLTPAEQAQLSVWAKAQPGCRMIFRGGAPQCERNAAFFLPEYLEEDDFAEQEEIHALKAQASFGTPGHRDYLGDLWLDGQTAYLFCLPSISEHLCSSLDRVGRYSVRLTPLPLLQVPAPQLRVKEITFTVQSPRFDVVLAGLFQLSRTQAAVQIRAGAAECNYLPCVKTDANVQPGDVLTLRGHGKGIVKEFGGTSRKGRSFVTVCRYL